MFLQSLILKVIRILLRFLKKHTQIKLLQENNPTFEPGYRDNALIVKEVAEETINPQHPYMEYMVCDQYRNCPICNYHLIDKWQCRPDKRLQLNHLKKSWYNKVPTCSSDGIHYHCHCDNCGCRWIVPLNVKMQKIELN